MPPREQAVSSGVSASKVILRRLARPIKPLVKLLRSALADGLGELRIRRQIRNAATVLEDACGVRFILYPWDRPYARHYTSRIADLHTFKAMSLLIRPGNVVLDVGAHIGIYSVIASRLCGVGGRVVAFEPVPTTYRRLRETLALNQADNVVAIQQAVCDRIGSVTMNVFEEKYAGWNSLGKPLMLDGRRRISPVGSIEVSSTTLDHLVEVMEFERIDFLKVDVEGFEKFVFQGAQRILRDRMVDFICFEISQDPLKGADVEARDVFDALMSCGYFIYRFRKGGFTGPINDCTDYWANFFASWRDLSAYRVERGANLTAVTGGRQLPREGP